MTNILDNIPSFEGPEKRLEVVFRATLSSEGLRRFGREEWQKVLDHAKCTIISNTSNEFFDAYVLSESSLFVYPTKIMLKTCGTTTLLRCLPSLFELAGSVQTGPEYLCFARRNFNFPQRQLHPHTSFESETSYLTSLFPKGHAYVFGSTCGDHWNLFTVDLRETIPAKAKNQTLEIMMSELDKDIMRMFYKCPDRDAKTTTKLSGIADLIPGSINDEVQFEPCGYSLNGLNKEALYTIHITPEDHCSYVSFETNLQLPDYTDLINHVLKVFNPGKVSVSLYADSISRSKFKSDLPNYQLKCKTKQQLENSYVTYCNYSQKTEVSPSGSPNYTRRFTLD